MAGYARPAVARVESSRMIGDLGAAGNLYIVAPPFGGKQLGDVRVEHDQTSTVEQAADAADEVSLGSRCVASTWSMSLMIEHQSR
jgi:hypothetical protein